MKTKTIVLALLALTSSLCACGEDSPQHFKTKTKQSELAAHRPHMWGVNVPGSAWSGRIVVCWDDTWDNSEQHIDDQTTIKNAIESTWGNSSQSYLKFLGWETCIGQDNELEIRRTNIGQPYSGSTANNNPSYKFITLNINKTLPTLEHKNAIKSLIAHEIGHALGFIHEHDRVNATCPPNDPSPVYSDYYELTIYDENSIMNKCNGITQMTDWDYDGLRRAYGFPRKYINKNGWCANGGKIYTGDFNGDNVDDLMCFKNGKRWFSFTNSEQTISNDLTYDKNLWCAKGGKIYIGDYDGDNVDDILCQNTTNAKYWIDFGNDGFDGNHQAYEPWCTSTGRMYIGDYNGDGSDDLLCHATNGKIWIDYSNDGEFNGSDYEHISSWCPNTGKLYVGDYNGDGSDDLLCHATNGKIWIDYSNDGEFYSSDWSYSDHKYWGKSFRFCTNQKMRVGDFNNDGLSDIVCHDKAEKRILFQFNTYNKTISVGSSSYLYEPFAFESWHGPLGDYCFSEEYTEDFFVGNFNKAANEEWPSFYFTDDLLCHNRQLGYISKHFPTNFYLQESSNSESGPSIITANGLTFYNKL